MLFGFGFVLNVVFVIPVLVFGFFLLLMFFWESCNVFFLLFCCCLLAVVASAGFGEYLPFALCLPCVWAINVHTLVVRLFVARHLPLLLLFLII